MIAKKQSSGGRTRLNRSVTQSQRRKLLIDCIAEIDTAQTGFRASKNLVHSAEDVV
jgi:hypothetical protein